jgi:hypothetical protein
MADPGPLTADVTDPIPGTVKIKGTEAGRLNTTSEDATLILLHTNCLITGVGQLGYEHPIPTSRLIKSAMNLLINAS